MLNRILPCIIIIIRLDALKSEDVLYSQQPQQYHAVFDSLRLATSLSFHHWFSKYQESEAKETNESCRPSKNLPVWWKKPYQLSLYCLFSLLGMAVKDLGMEEMRHIPSSSWIFHCGFIRSLWVDSLNLGSMLIKSMQNLILWIQMWGSP